MLSRGRLFRYCFGGLGCEQRRCCHYYLVCRDRHGECDCDCGGGSAAQRSMAGVERGTSHHDLAEEGITTPLRRIDGKLPGGDS